VQIMGAPSRRKPVASALCTLVVAGAVSLLPVGCGGQGDSATATKASGQSDTTATKASSQSDTTATKASGQGNDTTATKASGKRGSTASTESAPGCRRVEAPKPKKVSYSGPAQTVEPGEKLTAVVKTSCGTFEIALDAKRAPKTVNSFVFLAEEGFYDGLTFDLVSDEFLIQGGDPAGTGLNTSGPGYSVDEKPPPNISYGKGVVAMSQRSPPKVPPGHSGSQFFVVVAGDVVLYPVYAPLGKVNKGFSVVERIGKVGGKGDKPKQTVLIEKITIEKG
jgi:peptidyl-prolyl cis-trans isomerase B (cyclophilin B)